MGVHRTCGAPDEIKRNTHAKNITAFFRGQGHAAALAKDAIDVMYESKGGHGWFNVIHPPTPTPGPAAQPGSKGTGGGTGAGGGAGGGAGKPEGGEAAIALTGYEMRHVVDMFSMTFGLCGLDDHAPCDLDHRTRARARTGE